METTKVQWVKGRYKGKAALEIKALADEGIGYVILEAGKDTGEFFVVAAFHRAIGEEPLPAHLYEVHGWELEKVEKKWDRKEHKPRVINNASHEVIEKIKRQRGWK